LGIEWLCRFYFHSECPPISLISDCKPIHSTSSKSNAGIVDWIQDYLKRFNVESVLVPNSDNTKFNLLATIGPVDENGIVLSGHTDVVPVEGQIWQTDPFKLTEKDGKLFGRGSCDMKGFLACVLAAVPDMVSTRLSRPFHIAEMTVVDRHKGARSEKVQFVGVAAHSSLPHLGVSAIEFAARFVQAVSDKGVEFRNQFAQEADDSINITTVNIGTIHGGAAGNIVADSCVVDWNFRCAPGQDDQAILGDFHNILSTLEAEMKSCNPECEIRIEPGFDVPPLSAGSECLAREICQQITGHNQTLPVNYGTDAGFFKRAGIPTVICGPGSIEQAHKPDEFIAINELQACDAFLRSLITKFAD